MPQRWRMLQCSRKQNDEQRRQLELRQDNSRSVCHLTQRQSMMSKHSNKCCFLCVNYEQGCNWVIILNQETSFFSHFKAKIASASLPHRRPFRTQYSPMFMFMTLTETSKPLLVYFTLPIINCLPHTSPFPTFLWTPHIQKKEPVCWFQFCSYLYSRFCVPLWLNTLLFMSLFFMLLLFLFFLAHATQISNRRLHIVSHGLTLRPSTVDSSDGNQEKVSPTSAIWGMILILSQFKQRNKALWFKPTE